MNKAKAIFLFVVCTTIIVSSAAFLINTVGQHTQKKNEACQKAYDAQKDRGNLDRSVNVDAALCDDIGGKVPDGHI